jgi:hypothetical protein
MPAGQGHQSDLMSAVGLIPFRPLPVATRKKRFEKKNFHVNGLLNLALTLGAEAEFTIFTAY